MKNETNPRRGFLILSLGAIAVIGMAPLIKKAAFLKPESKKIKMLNAEGKLVEVDESLISELSSQKPRASNQEVQEWMQTSKL